MTAPQRIIGIVWESVHRAGAMVFHDIQEVFNDREYRWLHVSTLVYFVLLPFNAFGIPLPGRLPVFGTSVKYTELALLLVILFTMHALATRRLRIIHAPILYALLLLNAVAQFIAFPIASDRALLLQVGIAVARYSFLVFLLVNVLRSDRLIRSVLSAMGISCLAIITVTYSKFLSHSYASPGQSWLLEITEFIGRSTVHVLAYALIFFGAGLVYLFVREQRHRWVSIVLFVILALWTQLVFFAFVKVGQIVLLTFLCLLMLTTIRTQRWRAVLLLGMFFVVSWYRYNLIEIQNTARTLLSWRTTYALTVADRPPSPVTGDAIAAGLVAQEDRVVALASFLRAFVPEAASPSTARATSERVPVTISSASPPPPPPTVPPPPPPTVPPPPPPTVPPVDPFYTNQNLARLNWVPSRVESSFSIRRRGIAVGWVVGRTYPLTGIGAGQLKDKRIFDTFAEQVRREAQSAAAARHWKARIFVDEEVPAGDMDKGIFNIFMNAWAETGALGLIAIAGLLVVVMVRGLAALWRTRRSRVVLPIVVLFPLFLALVLYHQTVYLWVHPWFWSALALTYAAARVANDGEVVRAST